MAPAQQYIDFTADGNHNLPLPGSVKSNHDSASKKSLEHQHAHLHHSTNAKREGEDEVVYSQDKGLETTKIPMQNAAGLANVSEGRSNLVEPEKGSLDQFSSEDDPQSHTLSSFYSRYRLFFHLFIWLVFTASVVSLLNLFLRIELRYHHFFS